MSTSGKLITPESDSSYGDFFIDVSVGPKRWVRATVKTYDSTGKYVFLKLFKKNENQIFERYQQLSLSIQEWNCLMENRFAIDAPDLTVTPNQKRPAMLMVPGAPIKRRITPTSISNDMPTNPFFDTTNSVIKQEPIDPNPADSTDQSTGSDLDDSWKNHPYLQQCSIQQQPPFYDDVSQDGFPCSQQM
jgi:hypothetical protein